MLKKLARRSKWLYVCAGLVLSFVGAGTLSDSALAQNATWENQGTISYNGESYTGPNDRRFSGDDGQAFSGSGECASFMFFQAGTMDTATTVRFVTQTSNRGDCTPGTGRVISLSNVRTDAGEDDGTGGGGVGGGGGGQNVTTCSIPAIGWMICPIINLLADVTDGAYGLIERFLVYRPVANPYDTSSDNALYTVWSNVRVIANVAFIAAFFIVIFSQATSLGLSAYGIKRIMPRLVVAAILLNLSYYICLFAVDVSNIVGASLDGIIRAGLSGTADTGSPDGGASAVTFKNVTVNILAIGIATAIGLQYAAILAIVLPAALLAIAITAILIIGRQAAITILIILSPLAFAAYILPNTEDWFNRWRKFFITMLVFYPLVAVLYAGSQVASQITRTVPGEDQLLVQVFSLAILAIPLFATPLLLKVSGSLLSRIAGFANNPNKGPIDSVGKHFRDQQERTNAKRNSGTGFAGGVIGKGLGYNRRARNKEANNLLKARYDRETKIQGAEKYTDMVTPDESDGLLQQGMRRNRVGPAGTDFASKLEADAANIKVQLATDEVKAEALRVNDIQAPAIMAELDADKSSDTRTAALMQRLIAITDPEDAKNPDYGYKKYVDKYANDDGDSRYFTRKYMAEGLQANGPKALKGSNFDDIRLGTLGSTLDETVVRNIKQGVLSQNKLAESTGGEITYYDSAIKRVAEAESKDDKKEKRAAGAAAVLADTASKTRDNPDLAGAIKHNRDQINAIASTRDASVAKAESQGFSLQQAQNTVLSYTKEVKVNNTSQTVPASADDIVREIQKLGGLKNVGNDELYDLNKKASTEWSGEPAGRQIVDSSRQELVNRGVFPR